MGINYGVTSRRIAVPDKLAFPSLNSVGELALLDVAIAEVAAQANVTQWRDIRGAHDSRAWPADVAAYPGFEDELQPYLNRSSRQFDREKVLRRVKTEFQEARRMIDGGPGFPERSSNFVDFACELNARLAGGGEIRKGRVFIQQDMTGNTVEFPSAANCLPLLRSVGAFIDEHRLRYPAVSAVVGFLAVLHAHPFPDGNGRTARTIFNTMLRTGLNSGHFMPLSLIAHLSQGGFILKIRRAMHGAEWIPLTRCFRDGLTVGSLRAR